MASQEWLYSRGDDHQEGPVSANELNRLASSGELSPDDLVWKEGMDEWVPANRVKGLRFSSAAKLQSNDGEASKRFDAESLQSTFRDVQEHAEKAAGTLWFFDLKFNRFVSASIIRAIWAIFLLMGISGLALVVVGSIFQYPIFQAALVSAGAVFAFLLLALMVRVWLEVFMVVFRISEQLREMNSKLGQ